MVHDVPAGDALGQGQLHIVGVELIHHIPAHPHGVLRDVGQGQAEDGQDPSTYVVFGIEHGQVEGPGAVELDDQIVYHHRYGVQKHDEAGTQLVRQAALIPAHGHAQGDAHHQGQRHGDAAQGEGDRDLPG